MRTCFSLIWNASCGAFEEEEEEEDEDAAAAGVALAPAAAAEAAFVGEPKLSSSSAGASLNESSLMFPPSSSR